MTARPYQVYYGKSENVEAEYGSRAEDAYTIAEAFEGEIYAVIGYTSKAAMVRALREYQNDETTIERIG